MFGEHPFTTFTLFALLMMMIDNMWGNYMIFKIANQNKDNQGE